MNTNEKMRNLDEDYIIAFRNILKEAERMEREAMDRFHSWSNGMMDPAEEEDRYRSGKAGTDCGENEETDDLHRWREDETEAGQPEVPAEITKAGYSVPADSPYRNPENCGRRRRFRVSLLGDSQDDGEIHYYAPRPMIDQKDAYNAPVYPEKWTGSREEDS